ncbi:MULTISPECIES: phosphoglycerate mutase family protein [Winogradskyella]|uniref:Phosphoglycerate mutase family protein n=1 Tax=Winogradskyella damuponensis TaxID=943939 RepID=A0ABP8CMT1_9FLAO
MKKLITILLVSLVVFSSCKEKVETNEDIVTTYYLIRHAEKDRSDKTNKNPDLTKKGLQRAENWAKHLKNVKFDAVYSTEYNRTTQTAIPTAKLNNIDIQFYNPSNLMTEEFLDKTKGKTVLIVGHSNTIPKLANSLLSKQKYADIADDNNANLYKVTIKKEEKTSELSVVN